MKNEKLAKITEKIFFPTNILVIILTLILFLWGKERILINDIIVFILSFSTFLFASFLLRRRSVDENLLFFMSITSGVILLVFLSLFVPVSKKIYFAALCTIITTFVILPLRVVWKISLHTLAFNMMVTILTILDFRFAILFLFLPIVAWSRIKLKRHSFLQIVTGMYVGFLIPVIVYGSYLLVKLMINLYYLYFV